jgi:hydrogenase-4 membrane subunit HyfE
MTNEKFYAINGAGLTLAVIYTMLAEHYLNFALIVLGITGAIVATISIAIMLKKALRRREARRAVGNLLEKLNMREAIKHNTEG